jgi:hypothetical protein
MHTLITLFHHEWKDLFGRLIENEMPDHLHGGADSTFSFGMTVRQRLRWFARHYREKWCLSD